MQDASAATAMHQAASTEVRNINADMQKWRTRFVCTWMGILFCCCWIFSLGNIIHSNAWDRRYALEKLRNTGPDPTFYNTTFMNEKVETYYTTRYVWYIPHVTAAIIWWNFYFLQLIPQVRHNYKWFHRWLGRLLLLVAVVQVLTGFGMASTSNDSSIKSLSIPLAFAVAGCVVNAYRYALARDIERHKFWVLRLVGYLQTIAAQRFWLVVLLVTHQCGWHFLYPSVDDMAQSGIDELVRRMFADSFILAFTSAILITEWYLAGVTGMLDVAERRGTKPGYTSIPTSQ